MASANVPHSVGSSHRGQRQSKYHCPLSCLRRSVGPETCKISEIRPSRPDTKNLWLRENGEGESRHKLGATDIHFQGGASVCAASRFISRTRVRPFPSHAWHSDSSACPARIWCMQRPTTYLPGEKGRCWSLEEIAFFCPFPPQSNLIQKTVFEINR